MLLQSDFFQSILENLQFHFCDPVGLTQMCVAFALNLLVVWIIVQFFYYPKARRRDYYFTFLLLSASIFMLIYLMDGSKMEIGAALGLFAVFGIIRYRTESVPIREMTYLFFLVALSVVNGTASELSVVEKIVANLLFILIAWIGEFALHDSKTGRKLVLYDNIELIKPERYDELVADLEKRLGLEILRVEVGGVDFLKDSATLRVYYKDPDRVGDKTVDSMTKIRKSDAFS